MKILDHAKVVDDFQSSVNIDFDLSSPEKIRSYVPTSDVCEVLDTLLDSLLENNKQATFLIGAYGKGKSFLILALLQILSGKASPEAEGVFLQRVSSVRPDLANKIRTYIDDQKRYLPVIVNSDYDNLKQSFMVALKSALLDAGLDHLVPHSSFDQCAVLLQSWRSDQAILQGRLRECTRTIDLDWLETGLKNYSPEAYEEFVGLYNCVTIGQRFNPLINEDVPKLFAEVSSELKRFGYQGVFVVFDEFSKFLESKSKKLGEDLKFIQDFAEKCTRSGEHYSLHLCCVAHKAISQYGDNARAEDLLKTVEGRFFTLGFRRGMKENMELISNAIQKTADFPVFFENLYQEKLSFYQEVESLKLLEPRDDFKEFAKGCYPLNPLTAYCLVRVSELVAQNERTLFTFINGNDEASLKHLLDVDDNELISVPAIYDYFYDLFKADPSQHIKDVCYLCEASKRDVDENKARDILETLAVILIINDPRVLKSTRETIALGLGTDAESLREMFNELLRLSIIRESEVDGSISFSFAGSKEINEKAEMLLKKELRRIRPLDYLNRLCKSDCFYPREYNAVNRITRYSKYYYLDYAAFLALPELALEEERACDILIVRLLGENIDPTAAAGKVALFNKGNVIFEIPGAYRHASLEKLLRYYAAYSKMKEDADNRGSVGYGAIDVILDGCKDEIRNLVADGFVENQSRLFYRSEEITLGGVTRINRIFEQVYSASPIVNNEMVNRNVVSPQYRKVRNDLIDFILENGLDEKKWEKLYSETSAQNTLWRIFVGNLEVHDYRLKPVVERIKEMLVNEKGSCGTKIILDTLLSAPYGIRLGVIPLFLSIAISSLNSFDDRSVSLYFRKKEIPLNAANLEKAVSGDSAHYIFKTDEGARERGKFVASLLRVFGGAPQNSSSANALMAVNLMKNWHRNLPGITRTATSRDYPGVVAMEEELLLRELTKYDINPSEFLFGFLPGLFKEERLAKVLPSFLEIKADLDEKVYKIAAREACRVSEVMGFPSGNLLSNFKAYLSNRHYKKGSIVSYRAYAKMADGLLESSSFDDVTLLRELSFNLKEAPFDDWHRGANDAFLEQMKNWKSYFDTEYNPKEEQEEERKLKTADESMFENVSPLASLLENSIRSAIGQFGQSLNENDVRYVLTRLLNHLGDEK